MSRPTFVWHELHWQRPVSPDHCLLLLRQLASDSASPTLVFEARATAGRVRYLIGIPAGASSRVVRTIRQLIPGTQLVEDIERSVRVQTASSLRLSTRHRSLRVDEPEHSATGILAALAATQRGEHLVLRLFLGARRVPLAIPTNSPSSVVAPWWSVAWYGKGQTIDSEKRSALRDKVKDHGAVAAVWLGVQATDPKRRASLARQLATAIRTTATPGLKIRFHQLGPASFHRPLPRPWQWRLRLNVREVLTLLAWPLGEDELPAHDSLHPRHLAPPPGTIGTQRIVAASGLPGKTRHLSLPPLAATEHMLCLGPTGTGKSVLAQRLIISDIAAGRGVVVVDPKGDLVDDVLARVPDHRRHDVVVLDPSDSEPVGLNPLHVGGRSPDVVADGVLSVFKTLYADAWGPRLQDILAASLSTLARRPDSSLVMLPLLLTNPGFRRSLTATLNDPIALGPFWAWYEGLSDGERAAAIAPVMSRLRQWLLHRNVRAVLGQREPRFDIRQVFTERKVLLVPLRNGVVGREAARLLGSLLVAQLWQTIQARAAVPQPRRHPVMIYLDEAPQLLSTGVDLGEALALARGLGCGFTIAAQLLGQFDPALRAGILTNARSRVAFQLSHDDAVTMSRGHPEIQPEDFTSLNAYEVYASLVGAGHVTPYAFGRTLPPDEPTADAAAIRALSRKAYGRPLSEVEAGFANFYEPDVEAPVGRRKRS